MTVRSGVLPKSPLVFALASVRFAPWPLLAKKIDEIHNTLRDIAPLISPVQIQQLGQEQQLVVDSPAANIWMLLAKDRSQGIQITSDQLLFFTTSYKRYPEFQEFLKRGIRAMLDHMQFMDVTNAGARYVDRITIQPTESFADYINKSLLPAEILGFSNTGGETLSLYKQGGAELRVRCIAQPKSLNIPTDLLSVVVMSADPSKTVRLEPLKAEEFLLDIDAVKEFPEPTRMTNEAILEMLDELHKAANTFFRSEHVCTDHAFSTWGLSA